MRILFQERCKNRIQITISVRRLREEFRNLISGNISEGRKVRWSKWRRGRNTIDKYTSMELVNLVREEFSTRLRQET